MTDAKKSSVYWLGRFLQLADRAERIGPVETAKGIIKLRTEYEAQRQTKLKVNFNEK